MTFSRNDAWPSPVCCQQFGMFMACPLQREAPAAVTSSRNEHPAGQRFEPQPARQRRSLDQVPPNTVGVDDIKKRFESMRLTGNGSTVADIRNHMEYSRTLRARESGRARLLPTPCHSPATVEALRGRSAESAWTRGVLERAFGATLLFLRNRTEVVPGDARKHVEWERRPPRAPFQTLSVRHADCRCLPARFR